MNIQQINSELSITDFLAERGVHPSSKKGCDWWYISPIRAKERTPSFKVNTRLNRWYDHGSGEGGKVFDLALRFYPAATVREVVQLLSGQSLSPAKNTIIVAPAIAPPSDLEINAVNHKASPGLRLLAIKPLEEKSQQATYLRQRSISLHTAKSYCHEVDFAINAKQYAAIGFENRSGGYELRNRWFKGSSSPKDITFLDHQVNTICVVEGFMDFLSLLELWPHLKANASFLVLNSLTQLGKAEGVLDKHQQVLLFLDHDTAGRRVTAQLLNSLKKAVDASAFYLGFKDLNEHLVVSQGQAKQRRLKFGHR
ncbi:toprim domain-containing protein [Pontibacter sp. MBLB2868]|uniref:toprim domain-containing protein n=1 Tax=Pontibacter sp. MBLB2868 TaxID=3451555 RepID=UPI003F755D79